VLRCAAAMVLEGAVALVVGCTAGFRCSTGSPLTMAMTAAGARGARGLQGRSSFNLLSDTCAPTPLSAPPPITRDGAVQRVQSFAAYPMDYQTFNGAQPSFGGFPSSAHSPQSALPPQAQFQQSNQSFPYGSQFASNAPAFPSTAGLVGHGPGHGSSSASGAPMNMMQQPMQPGAGGMQRGERVTRPHRSRPGVSCCPCPPASPLWQDLC
jgi:hypothetical protein